MLTNNKQDSIEYASGCLPWVLQAAGFKSEIMKTDPALASNLLESNRSNIEQLKSLVAEGRLASCCSKHWLKKSGRRV
jgi:hypothetical protein